MAFISDGWSGPWRHSLNFTLSKTHFDQIDLFHKGLSFLERGKTESFCLGGIKDSIGNAAVYDDHGDLKCRKNTRNVALASVQFVYSSSGVLRSHFSHLTARDGQRFFYSSKTSYPYVDDVQRHLRKKVNPKWQGHYYPNKMAEKPYFAAYHQHPHAEDYIFYELSRNSEQIVQSFVNDSLREKTDSIEAIILHLNTRFDMCGNCAYTLDWELRDQFGFAQLMVNEAVHLGRNSSDIFASAFISSRQDYSGVWGPSRRSLPEVISGPTTKPYKFDDFTSRLQLSSKDDRQFFHWAVPSFFDVPSLSVSTPDDGWILANS